MRILIAGGGQVALHTARRLIREGNEVVIVEQDAARCEQLDETLDARVVRGNAASVETMQRAGLREADMLIAVTSLDEVNLLACLIAQAESKVKVKVARVRTHEVGHWRRIAAQTGLNIDLIIHPESEAVARILPVLQVPGVSDIVDFADGKVKLFGSLIEPDHWGAGKTMIELTKAGPPEHSLIALIFRGADVIIPHGEEKILAGDHVYVITRDVDLNAVLGFMGVQKQERLERVFVLGGNQIGIQVADELEKRDVSVKLFEANLERCKKISEILEDTIIIHGDGTDAQTLTDENVKGVGAYLALTHDDEDNLIAALLARRLGARKVVALINRLNYLPMAQRLGINTCVSPRLATVDRILRFVRKGEVVSVTTFREEEAEAIELVAGAGSRYVGKKLKDIRLPREAIVGAIARPGGEVLIPRGEASIEAGDRVIFFASEKVVPELESAFLSEGRR
ncbi:MAG: Trk system potassium transporter TrkA [Bryobacteraceae bacterium]|nr:Trk system potassium transporter TrkA [Bryobacteraceae bacterium]